MLPSWITIYYREEQMDFKPLIILVILFAIIFMAVGFVYDLGVRQGETQALKTAYEVCKKVAPFDGSKGCQ